MNNFVRAWDLGRSYFFKSDVTEFSNKYGSKLNSMIQGNKYGSAIDDIMNRYTRRFEERHKHIATLIDAKHDFSIDEYLTVDRRQVEYPETLEEVNERWRKRSLVT